MKLIVTTNEFQAQRSFHFKSGQQTAILRENISVKEGKTLLRDIAIDCGANNVILENGDVFDTSSEDVIYEKGEKSFEDDGYTYKLVPNHFKLY